MNQNEDKSEVARKKILKYYFSVGGDKASAFAQMSEKVMPFALEWIGRTVSGFSLMYNVVRGNPTLFDMTHVQQHLRASKRRKRDSEQLFGLLLLLLFQQSLRVHPGMNPPGDSLFYDFIFQ